MKRTICFFLLLAVTFGLCGCAKTNIAAGEDVTLLFVNGEKKITVTLEPQEVQTVIDILDGNPYELSTGVPACGFDENIGFRVGDHSFAIARDTCNMIQDCENGKYFSVSQDEIAYIHTLFEHYGGYFPCV